MIRTGHSCRCENEIEGGDAPTHYAKINFRWHMKNSVLAGNISLVSTDNGTIYAGGAICVGSRVLVVAPPASTNPV
jgi:hypothetical protein